jgi:uncharacterized protein (TIGR00251 family)
LREAADGVSLAVWVSPRASRDEVLGVVDGWLRVRLAASPHEGRANAALMRFVGGLLGVAPSTVRLMSGATSRRKVLRVHGVTLADARRKLRL